MSLKKIVVFTTGGTISSKYENGKIVPFHTGEQLLSHVSSHLTDLNVELVDKGITPGPHLTPQFGFSLANEIKTYLKREDICGAVVLQGTDSLDEMSYLHHLMLPCEKPVVFSGSMKSGNELYVDASGNLLGAIELASSDLSAGHGVMVYFDETIHSARDVEKHHANKMGAFVSPGGPLGGMYNGRIIFHHEPVRDALLHPQHMDAKVGLLKVCTGMEDIFIRSCIDNNYDGLVLEGFGAGNIPPVLMESLMDAIGAGMVVVIVSRCFDGRAMPVYQYKGGGAQLSEIGVVCGGNLSGQKARIKLMMLLSIDATYGQITDYFN